MYNIIIGNEITQVEGLEALRSLTELVLDRNKIKVRDTTFYSTLSFKLFPSVSAELFIFISAEFT